MTVNPTSVTVQPGISETISITVGVPLSPTHSCDIERVTASIGGTQPYTATSYLVTIAERHEFADVHAGDWADNYVQYLYSQGAVSGYADGTFRPYDYVTRSQFAKMLVNVMGWQIETPANPTFSDVASDNWAYGYVETAYAHGVISGYADGSFHPLATVTRAQVSKMISTANNWTMEMPYNSSFSDVLTSDWFFGYAEMSRSAQVLGGYADGSFQPNAPATRAQIAKILTLSLYSNPSDY